MPSAPVKTSAYYFNPLPRKEGDMLDIVGTHQLGNFNPLPRKEGDSNPYPVFSYEYHISIHSLVKRETKQVMI